MMWVKCGPSGFLSFALVSVPWCFSAVGNKMREVRGENSASMQVAYSLHRIQWHWGLLVAFLICVHWASVSNYKHAGHEQGYVKHIARVMTGLDFCRPLLCIAVLVFNHLNVGIAKRRVREEATR